MLCAQYSFVIKQINTKLKTFNLRLLLLLIYSNIKLSRCMFTEKLNGSINSFKAFGKYNDWVNNLVNIEPKLF